MQARLSLVSQTTDTTDTVVEPLTLDEVKKHLRIDPGITDEDELLQDYISAARERGENETNRQFITATWKLQLDNVRWDWDDATIGAAPWFDVTGFMLGLGIRNLGPTSFIDIPKPPLQATSSSDVTVTYVDTSGVTQTWDPSNYDVDAPQGPVCERGRLRAKFGIPWPITQYSMNALTVQFKAGYGDTGDKVPPMLRHAMRLIVGEMYENREDLFVARSRALVMQLPYGAQQIFSQYRIRPVTHQG